MKCAWTFVLCMLFTSFLTISYWQLLLCWKTITDMLGVLELWWGNAMTYGRFIVWLMWIINSSSWCGNLTLWSPRLLVITAITKWRDLMKYWHENRKNVFMASYKKLNLGRFNGGVCYFLDSVVTQCRNGVFKLSWFSRKNLRFRFDFEERLEFTFIESLFQI